MRTMYDGVRQLAQGIARTFPAPTMVAGYINGDYAWTAAEWDLFPYAVKLRIVVTAIDDGDILDVEKGDASPSQTEGWITQRKAAGYYRPTIYCDLYTVPAVRQGTGKYILGKDYDLWFASYDNSVANTYPGAAAKQFRNTPYYDESVVYDDAWPHRSASTPAQPVHTLTKAKNMIILQTVVSGHTVTFTYDGTSVKHIVSVADQEALAKTLPVVKVTEAQLLKFNGGTLPIM